MKVIKFTTSALLLFSIACLGQQWPLPPTTISTPGVNASSPRAAVDVSGNIVAVWLENTVVMSSSTVPKAAWSAPAALSGSGADSPRVVIDAAGKTTAIWAENGSIKVATKTLGGSWSASTTISSGSGASFPQLGVDSTGDLVAVWAQNGLIMSSTKLSNGSWNLIPDTLSLDLGASFPRLAVNASGAVVVVWQQPVSSIPTVYAAEKQMGGLWGVGQVISSAGVNSAYPRVAIDASGNAIVAWFQYQFANNQYSAVFLQAVQQVAGLAWGLPVNVSSSASVKNPADLVINVAYNGVTPVINWTSSTDGSTFNLDQATFAQGSWNIHPRLVESNWGLYSTNLGIGPTENNGTVWMRADSINNTLIIEGTTTTYDGFEDLNWVRWTFSNAGYNAYPVTVAGGTSLAPAGVLVWTNYNGTNTSIQAITSALKIVQPPTGVSVVQQGTNFGVLTRYDNVLNWTASTSKNLWGYAIERDGLPLVLVNAKTVQYSDLNQDLNAPATYQIATIDINGFQSEWVTVSFP